MTKFDRYTDYTTPQTTDRFLIRDITSGLVKSVTFTNLRNAISTASGDASTNTSASVDSELAVFSGTGGKTLKRATQTGIIKATSGVIGTATAGTDYYNPGGTDVAITDGGTGASSASAARTNLGVVIGTDVQAHGNILDDLNAISPSQGDILYNNGTNWVRLGAGTNGQILRTNGTGANPSWGTSSAGQTIYEAVVAPSGGDYTTISAAVTAGKTRIFVRNGTYGESAMSLAANTHITGESMDGVIIQMGANSITIGATNIHIDNLTFTTWPVAGAIISNTSADYCTISNVKVDCTTSFSNPFQLGGTVRMAIHDCQFINSQATIVNAFILDGSPGMSCMIYNCIFKGAFKSAISCGLGSIIRFTNNWISSGATGITGALVDLSANTALHDCLISGNYMITGGAVNHHGITMNQALRVTVSNNHIGVGNARAINLVDVDDSFVHGNYIEDAAYGIYIDASCNNVMTRNNYLARCTVTPYTDLGASTNSVGDILTTTAQTFSSAKLGIGVTAPTALMHLKAGTATANTAPLKFTSGTNLTTAEAGAMEYDGTKLYFSPSTTRRTVYLLPSTPQTYSATNVTTDRTYDANATTLDELADIVGTLIADLRTEGVVA